MVKVCFDYGHGGRDSGAIYKGRKESMDNLDIGMKVAERARIFSLEVGETRTTDINIGLKERVDFANSGNYDYFISFHRNAFKPELANGVEIFIHPNASWKSNKLGIQVQKTLVRCGFRDRRVKEANFYVLRQSIMPAILMEIGFIDNSLDNCIFDIRRKEITNQLAKAIILNTVG